MHYFFFKNELRHSTLKRDGRITKKNIIFTNTNILSLFFVKKYYRLLVSI